METTKIALFRGNKIRKTLYKSEWWFSILDVIAVLADTPTPKTYWAKMKGRDKELSQPFPFWEQLKLTAIDGKMRETDCADTEGLFRIIQSIPSPKAEPFKRWLAKVGFEKYEPVNGGYINIFVIFMLNKDYDNKVLHTFSYVTLGL